MAAVIQLAQPIGFDAPDEQAVNLLIFLLVPEAATQKHLEILSEIAEMLSDVNLREKACFKPGCSRTVWPDIQLALGTVGVIGVDSLL
jgi:PTS system nitrogen regulatory IIA component